MDSTSFEREDLQASPDILSAIIKAGETYSIVASQDIVDVSGLKLWAKGRQVSTVLQQRLLERNLQQPIEACLTAQDGVTLFYLMEQMVTFLGEDTPLSRAVRPWGSLLQNHLKQIPLHPVAQLVLTAALATRPDTLSHAVQAMALAGAIAQVTNAQVDTRLAMLGGLLHDIGEAYIQPEYLDGEQPLDLLGHKHMMVHPRVAQLLLSSTTDYPEALCRAVGEHHERLNGSGYPARLAGKAISPLGNILTVVELTMGIARSTSAPLTRASFALRVVPGEFSDLYSSVVFNMARAAKEALPQQTSAPVDALQQILGTLDQAEQTTQALRSPGASAESEAIVALAVDRLARLRVAWNALGVWGLSPDALSSLNHFEMEMAAEELHIRLHDLQRECMLLAERIPEAERLQLEPIWAELQVQA